MSTRATIKITERNESFRVYHHCDGYPEGIGEDLKDYLSNIKWWYADDITNDLIKGKCGTRTNIWSGEVGGDNTYEITSCVHGDEEYFYLIDCLEKTLSCYKMGFDWPEEKTINEDNLVFSQKY